jgi:excisionase family DNA binding protein
MENGQLNWIANFIWGIADDVLSDIHETSAYQRIPLCSQNKLAQEGRIPCQKVGRHLRFRRQALDRWLDAYPQTGVSPKIEDTEQIGGTITLENVKKFNMAFLRPFQ